MSKTVVLTAYRGDGGGYGGSGWRDRAFTFVWDYLTSHIPAAQIITHDSGHQPFNISQTYNQAAEKAGDWDKAVIHPPDVFVPWPQIEQAIEIADSSGAVWTYDHIVKMNKHHTEQFYASEGSIRFKGQHYPWAYPPFVVSREVWNTVGGFYEGLKGHGAEDGIFKHCTEVLCGPQRRIPGTMYTFYHPRKGTSPDSEIPDYDKEFYAHQDANLKEREKIWAIKDPEALRAFLKT